MRANSLYYGDCLDVMRGWPDGSFDLVYLDPPFNSKANYNILFGTGGRGGNLAQVLAFEDTWSWDDRAAERVDALRRAEGHPAHDAVMGLHIALGDCGMVAYLSYMAERLAEIRRVLKATGSVYLHCDQSAGHYLKVLMDAVFGQRNFVAEIVWNYGTSSGGRVAGRKPVKTHDVLLFYACEYGEHVYNIQYTPYGEKYVKDWFRHDDGDGRKYQTRVRKGELVKQYLDESPGVPLSMCWSDIRQIYGQQGWFPGKQTEHLGYPTQKPVSLLERVIKASSNEGDLVLDPFCGCGTTVDAANRLGRRWVGIDVSPFAIDLVRKRRLQDSRIPVHGVPVDVESARVMAREAPFEFEKWAVSRIEGMAPNSRQVGDGGVDGRGRVYEASNGNALVLAQVKGGKFGLSQLRDFLHTVDREGAGFGVFVTLDKVSSRAAKVEAAGMGKVRMGAKAYPRVQLWSIEEHFDDREPRLPPLADPYTGKRMQKDLLG